MAHHLRSILGDMLVTKALDSQNPEELPSPEVMPPDPQLGRWVGLMGFHPWLTHAAPLVQDPSLLSARTFSCSAKLTSATQLSPWLPSVPCP